VLDELEVDEEELVEDDELVDDEDDTFPLDDVDEETFPLDELVLETPPVLDEVELDPPLEVDETTMLPLDPPPPPKKPPAKNPPPNPPKPPLPPTITGAWPPPPLITGAGGNGIGAPWLVTVTTCGVQAVEVRVVTTLRTRCGTTACLMTCRLIETRDAACVSATWTAPPPMIAPPHAQAHSFAKAIRTDMSVTSSLLARHRPPGPGFDNEPSLSFSRKAETKR